MPVAVVRNVHARCFLRQALPQGAFCCVITYTVWNKKPLVDGRGGCPLEEWRGVYDLLISEGRKRKHKKQISSDWDRKYKS